MQGLQTHIKNKFKLKDADYDKIKLLFLFSFSLGFFIAFYFVPANSKFLENYGHYELPYAYILSGIVGLLAISVYSHIQKKQKSKTLFISAIIFMFIIAILSKIALFLLEKNLIPNISFDTKSTLKRLISFFVFIWAWPFIALVATITGGLTLRLFNLLQVKKFYGLINVGGVSAATLSYFLIAQILKLINNQYDLILIGSIGLIASFFLIIYIYKKFPEKNTKKTTEKIKKTKHFNKLLKNKFIIFIFIEAIISGVLIYIADYGFLITVKENSNAILGGDQAVAKFLSLIFGGLKIGEFLISMFSGRILTKGGLRLGLILMPLLITTIFITAFISAELVGVISITFLALMTSGKTLERITRRGIDDPAFNVLYQTLPENEKLFVQTRVGIAQQASIAIAGLLLLLINFALRTNGTNFELKYYPLYSLPIMTLAIYFAFQLYTKYKDKIKEILAEKKLFKLEYNEPEIFANDILKKFILSKDREASKFSTVVLSETNPRSLEPYTSFLIKVDDTIIRKSILANIDSTYNKKLIPIIENLGNHGAITDKELKKLFLQAFFKLDYSEIKKIEYSEIQRLATSTNNNLKITVTKHLFKNSYPADEDIIYNLLDSSNKNVRIAAIKIAGKRKTKKLLQKLISILNDPGYNNILISILIEIGDPILDDLNIFFNKQHDIFILIKIIQIYANIGTKKAQKYIISHIDFPSREIQNLCIQSLKYSAFRAKNENLNIIQEQIKQVVENIIWFLVSIKDVVREKNTLRLVQSLDLERQNSLEQLFTLLSFTQSAEIVELIKINIIGENTIFALELIDNFIEPEIKKMIIPLFEPISIGQKMKRLKPYFVLKSLEFEQRLIEIILTDNRSIDIWSQLKAIELIGKIVPENIPPPGFDNNFITEPKFWDKKTIENIKKSAKILTLTDALWISIYNPAELIFSTAIKILFNKKAENINIFLSKVSENKNNVYKLLTEKSSIISDKIKMLRRVYLFYSVPEKSLIRLAKIADFQNIAKNKTVSFNKEEHDNVLIIAKGKLSYGTTAKTTFNKNSILIKGLNIPQKTKLLKSETSSIVIKINRFQFFNLLASNNDLVRNMFKTMKF